MCMDMCVCVCMDTCLHQVGGRRVQKQILGLEVAVCDFQGVAVVHLVHTAVMLEVSGTGKGLQASTQGKGRLEASHQRL